MRVHAEPRLAGWFKLTGMPHLGEEFLLPTVFIIGEAVPVEDGLADRIWEGRGYPVASIEVTL